MSNVITQFGVSGISLILDKSAFQALSKSQLEMLCKYYWFTITPILVREVLGDLKKKTSDGSLNSKRVSEFASKLSGLNTSINAHYSVLITAELQGLKIPFFSSMVDTGERYQLDEKETGIIIQPSSDRKSIDRWKEGAFEEMDELFSKLWREITQKPDKLTNLKEFLTKQNPELSHLRDPAEILAIIKMTFNNPHFQRDFLKLAIENFHVSIPVATEAFYRWETMKPENLFHFAPYTFFCVATKLFFNICLQNGIIGTRSTNLLDLDYLYYLPFCSVFVSDDKVHKTLVPHLLVSGQLFVTGKDLKDDFIKIEEIKQTLTGEELRRTHREPPREESLLSYKIWKTMLNDWPPEKDWKPSAAEQQMMQEMITKMRSSGKFNRGPVE